MEDKELQELFAAGRTAEANRQRQQRLTAALGAEKQKHPLWPLWTGAAAAAVAAVFLLAQPSNDVEVPLPTMQVAQHIAPVVEEPPVREADAAPTIPPKHTPLDASIVIAEELPPVEEITPTIISEEPAIADTPAPAIKTVHRRRASRLVQHEAPRRENIFQILAERISIDTSDNPFYKNINIKTSSI